MKPIIGITTVSEPDPSIARTGGEINLHWNYAQSVADAGGVPVLIPAQAEPAEILPFLDGILIPGGADIDAANWGEPNHPAVVPVASARFEAERRLVDAAPESMPILGICYGCQLINVMRGGSLIQHLASDGEALDHEKGAIQSYELEQGSQLAGIVGTVDMKGQSWHHQAINEVGSGLRIVGRSEDDVIEAIEASDRPWMIGVQWHPERSLDEDANLRLFKEFVSAAGKFRTAKGTHVAAK